MLETRMRKILDNYDLIINKALKDGLTAQEFYLALGGAPYVLEGDKAVLLLDKKPWLLEDRLDAEVVADMALTHQRPILYDSNGKRFTELPIAPEPKKGFFERPFSRRAKIFIGAVAIFSLIGVGGFLTWKHYDNQKYITMKEFAIFFYKAKPGKYYVKDKIVKVGAPPSKYAPDVLYFESDPDTPWYIDEAKDRYEQPFQSGETFILECNCYGTYEGIGGYVYPNVDALKPEFLYCPIDHEYTRHGNWLDEI